MTSLLSVIKTHIGVNAGLLHAKHTDSSCTNLISLNVIQSSHITLDKCVIYASNYVL